MVEFAIQTGTNESIQLEDGTIIGPKSTALVNIDGDISLAKKRYKLFSGSSFESADIFKEKKRLRKQKRKSEKMVASVVDDGNVADEAESAPTEEKATKKASEESTSKNKGEKVNA